MKSCIVKGVNAVNDVYTTLDKDAIKARVNLVAWIGKDVELKEKRSGEWMGRCPFHHDKNPSFSVNPHKDGGVYHCLGCPAHGDIFSYIMAQQHVSFHEALRIAAGEAGDTTSSYLAGTAYPAPSAPRHRFDSRRWGVEFDEVRTRKVELQAVPTARKYLQSRGLHPLFAQESNVWAVSHWRRPAIVFPLVTGDGNTIACNLRYYDDQAAQDKERRYFIIQVQEEISDGLFWTLNAADFAATCVVLTEGPFDALACGECGFPAFALCGATKTPPSWFCQRAREKSCPVIVCFDADNGGDSNAPTVLNALRDAGVTAQRISLPIPGCDINDLIRQYGMLPLREKLQRAVDGALAHYRR